MSHNPESSLEGKKIGIAITGSSALSPNFLRNWKN